MKKRKQTSGLVNKAWCVTMTEGQDSLRKGGQECAQGGTARKAGEEPRHARDKHRGHTVLVTSTSEKTKFQECQGAAAGSGRLALHESLDGLACQTCGGCIGPEGGAPVLSSAWRRASVSTPELWPSAPTRPQEPSAPPH